MNKMNLTIATVGSRGDIQPYVALGRGLQQAGHHIQLAAELGRKIRSEDGVARAVEIIEQYFSAFNKNGRKHLEGSFIEMKR